MRTYLLAAFLIQSLSLAAQPTGNSIIYLHIYELNQKDTLNWADNWQGGKKKWIDTTIQTAYFTLKDISTSPVMFSKAEHCFTQTIYTDDHKYQLIRNGKDTMTLAVGELSVAGEYYLDLPFQKGDYAICLPPLQPRNLHAYSVLPTRDMKQDKSCIDITPPNWQNFKLSPRKLAIKATAKCDLLAAYPAPSPINGIYYGKSHRDYYNLELKIKDEKAELMLKSTDEEHVHYLYGNVTVIDDSTYLIDYQYGYNWIAGNLEEARRNAPLDPYERSMPIIRRDGILADSLSLSYLKKINLLLGTGEFLNLPAPVPQKQPNYPDSYLAPISSENSPTQLKVGLTLDYHGRELITPMLPYQSGDYQLSLIFWHKAQAIGYQGYKMTIKRLSDGHISYKDNYAMMQWIGSFTLKRADKL